MRRGLLWAVAVVAVAWLSLPVIAFVPEFLGSDLRALFAHFKITHVTIVHNGTRECLASHEFKAEVKVAAGELRVFVDSVRCAEMTLGRTYVGAVFYPAVQTKQPCAADVMSQLILGSSPERPLFLHSSMETSTPRWLHDVYIPFNTSVLLILRQPLDARALTLQEVYHLDPERVQLHANVLGTYSVTSLRWRWLMHGPVWTRRADLMGTEIAVVYPEEGTRQKSRAHLVLNRFDSILRLVFADFNASIKPSYTSAWQTLLPTLEKRQADLAYYPTTLKVNQGAFEVSSPYETSSSRLYLRKPSFTYSLRNVLRTFTLRTWAASVAVLLALSAALAVATRTAHAYGGDAQQPFTFAEGLLLTLGNACVQGWERLPGSASGRMLCVASIWTGLLLNAFFVSQLQAGLSSTTATLPFRGIDELLRTNYHVFIDRSSGAYPVVQEARTETLKQLRSVTIYNKSYLDVGFCEKPVALLISTFTEEFYSQHLNCTVADTQVDEFKNWLSVPMVSHFRFKRLINFKLRRMVESGLVQRNVAAQRKRTEVAARDDADSFEQIGLDKVMPFLRIYAFSLVAVAAIFVAELACSFVRTRIG